MQRNNQFERISIVGMDHSNVSHSSSLPGIYLPRQNQRTSTSFPNTSSISQPISYRSIHRIHPHSDSSDNSDSSLTTIPSTFHSSSSGPSSITRSEDPYSNHSSYYCLSSPVSSLNPAYSTSSSSPVLLTPKTITNASPRLTSLTPPDMTTSVRVRSKKRSNVTYKWVQHRPPSNSQQLSTNSSMKIHTPEEILNTYYGQTQHQLGHHCATNPPCIVLPSRKDLNKSLLSTDRPCQKDFRTSQEDLSNSSHVKNGFHDRKHCLGEKDVGFTFYNQLQQLLKEPGPNHSHLSKALLVKIELLLKIYFPQPGTNQLVPLNAFLMNFVLRSYTTFSTLLLAGLYLSRFHRNTTTASSSSSTSLAHDEKVQIRFRQGPPSSCSNYPFLNTPPSFEPFHHTHTLPQTPCVKPIYQCARRMFLASLIVAHKYLHEPAPSNKSWAKLTGLPIEQISLIERIFLCELRYDLHVTEQQFVDYTCFLFSLK